LEPFVELVTLVARTTVFAGGVDIAFLETAFVVLEMEEAFDALPLVNMKTPIITSITTPAITIKLVFSTLTIRCYDVCSRKQL
jgi:hypothetical protein